MKIIIVLLGERALARTLILKRIQIIGNISLEETVIRLY